MRDAARAVHYAHQRGIVHRDLKPANILLDRTNRPKVTDFGLAKRLANDSSLTATGQVLGTPSYMPPEQAAGKIDQVGPLADVYALGAVLYASLTGHPPFQAATPAATLQQVLDQDPVAVGQFNKAVPRDLETITLKCLEKPPERRYVSAADLADDLDRWLTGQTIQARRSRAWERAIKWARRRPAVAALSGGLAAVTLVAFALVTSQWYSSHRSATRQTLAAAQNLCGEGDVSRGVLLIDDILSDVPIYGKDLDHSIRASIGAWRKQLVPLVSFLPNRDTVQIQTFSNDGRRLLRVYGHHNDIAEVLDVEQGKPIRSPMHHPAPIHLAMLSPTGNHVLIAAGHDEMTEISVWPIDESQSPQPIPIAGLVTAAAFAPDGKTVVTASTQHALQAWDLLTGANLANHSATGTVSTMVYSPDGQTVATGTTSGVVELWRADSLLPAEFQPEHPTLKSEAGQVRTLVFALGGKRLLALIEDERQGMGDVPTWDTANGRFLENLNNTPWEIKAVAASRDGRHVLTGAGDYSAQLWEVSEQKLTVKAVLRHEDIVDTVAFSPDKEGLLVVTGSQDGTARIWEASTGKPVCPPVAHPGPVQTVVFSDAAKFSTISQDESVRLWEIPPASDDGWRAAGKVMALAISPNGKWVAAATNGGNVHVRNTHDGTERWSYKCHDDEIWAIAFLNDNQLVTGGLDWTVRCWDIENGTLFHEFTETYCVRSLAASPDGKSLLIGGGDSIDSKAVLRTLPTGDWLNLPLLEDEGVDAVAFSPNRDTNRCAVASGKTIQLWLNLHQDPAKEAVLPADEAETSGDFVELSPPHEVRVVALAFSPDGKCLASGSIDKTVRLWNAENGAPQGEPLRHISAVWSVAFSADGAFLVTGCSDGSVHVWDVATGLPVGPA